MPTKSIYIDPDLIKYVKKMAKKEGRSFSNYLDKLIRADQRKVKK